MQRGKIYNDLLHRGTEDRHLSLSLSFSRGGGRNYLHAKFQPVIYEEQQKTMSSETDENIHHFIHVYNSQEYNNVEWETFKHII